jgi:hypothetical protein
MASCDICNREGPNAIVPCATFRRAVLVDGLDPFRLDLVPGRMRANAAADLDAWRGLVRADDTDWGLCAVCHAAFEGVTATRVAPVVRSNLPASLAALRATHSLPAPPEVPANWRAGFFARLFSRPAPWGGPQEAVALVRHGRIAEARELLRRLVANGDDGGARLCYCLESLRPPQDPALLVGKVVPSLPEADKLAVDMLVAFVQGDYNWLGEALLAAAKTQPDSPIGAFLLLAGFVGGSDLWLQTQLLHPRHRELSSRIVSRPVKAIALLLERRHDEAWQVFQEGVADPDSVLTSYAKLLQVEPTGQERQDLASAVGTYCDIGLGLVLHDLGYEVERRAHFERLPRPQANNLAEAYRLLAR